MKTVKQDEPIARSRFVDCPVCKNHTLKLKRTVQVGRCRSCNETYKILVVFVKTSRKSKQSPRTDTGSAAKSEAKQETVPESSLPAWQPPSDSSLFGSSGNSYAGLSEAVFGESRKDKPTETGSPGAA